MTHQQSHQRRPSHHSQQPTSPAQKLVPHFARFAKRVKRNLSLMPSFVALALLITTQTATADQIEKPNVILILADDLAVGDLAGGGGFPTRTPNLDRMAQSSVQFTNAYSGSCVCAPARAALLTGRYPHRTGVVTLNMLRYPKMTQLRRDEITIADMLRDAGYATGLIGKWHVGLGDGFHPLDRGFDEFEGFDGSQENMSYFNYLFDVNRHQSRVDDNYLTDDLSNRAIEFIRRHRDEPFFLHLAHYAPHRPLDAPAAIVERYRKQGFDESTATIYAMIEVMDRGIGELLAELTALKISQKTVVIFASDNGPDPLTGERFNSDLRGTKYQIYEGGIRVPLFVRWTGQFEPGKRDQLVHFVDIVPTIRDLAKIDAAPKNPLDGNSLTPVLKDAATEFTPTRYWQWNRTRPNYTHNAAIRNGRYKLVRPFVTRGSKLKDSTLPPALYDLKTDPSESTDISAKDPERVKQMNRNLERWTQSIENDRRRPLKPASPR